MRRLIALALVMSAGVLAQDRITQPIDATRTALLPGHVHPLARPQDDRGPVDPAMQISYATIHFAPHASLEPFLAAQQNASSPDFHRWLTPEQFADRFGLSSADTAKVSAWLRSQGLTVHDVARGRHWITFSGSAERTGRAFHTEFHHFKTHFANTVAPSVPAALASIVSGISGFDDYGLQPLYIRAPETPAFNSGSNHFLAPDDIATIYDIAPLYTAGIDGTGQKIVVVGQTAIDVTDIRAFRTRFNLPASDPQVVLVGTDPGTSPNDLPEADLDIEWSGAVARGAAIVYVYSRSASMSAQYAVDQKLAPVISMSYGTCELLNTPVFRSVAQQANAEGITWMAASGDWGAASCDDTAPTPQASRGATQFYPSTIPEITAVGGTEFNEGTGSYWNAGNNANSASALSYIPERVWNDAALENRLTGGGGGPSGLFTKPAWQTGPGVPADGARDVPDVALTASADHDGYEVYTSGAFHIIGGTSVATPVFAGIVALLNQYQASHGVQGGQGNINPTLYRMAQSTTDVFHDVTTGDNMVPCEQISPNCVNGYVGFPAGPGYDLATGLGSVDANNLIHEWKNATATTTTLAAAPATVNIGDIVQLTAAVAAGTGKPTGSVTFLANDKAVGAADLSSSGTASLGMNSSLIGPPSGVVTAFYSGDSAFAASSGTVTVTVSLPASGSAVVPSVSPYPVYEIQGAWPYIVSLTEKAGIATTLTGFTVDGITQNLSFWSSTNIPSNGTVRASLVGAGLMPPVNRQFMFTGMDANGKGWSQALSVPFVGPIPELLPSIALTATPATVPQNPQADPSCQWSHQLILQEQSGYPTVLTRLTASGTDMTSSIQQLFGTTRLAPFGTLQATVCWSGLTPPTTKNYAVATTTDLGLGASAAASASFAAALPNPPMFTVSPNPVNLGAADATQTATATVSLNVTGAAAQWSASVLPASRAGQWLTVSPATGAGAGQLTLKASAAGLSNGVYPALVIIQPTNALPASITIPVTLTVGGSAAVSITGLANAASFRTVFAPGMLLSVFGSNLATNSAQAGSLPLPLKLANVSATVNGITAPFYYASATQLNVQVPYETGAGAAVLAVNNNGQVASFPFQVAVTAPGIFADGSGALVPVNSGKPGDTLLAFITGEGDVTPALATGATPPASTPLNRLPAPRQPVALTVGGVPATIVFAGIPSGLAGVTQINFIVPANAPAGVQPVVVTVGGVASPPVNLNVVAQ